MHLDIFVCFKDIQYVIGRKNNPMYKAQLSHVKYMHTLYLTPEWCWEKTAFFSLWRNLKSIHVQSMNKLSSRTQKHFCHSGIVKTFKYKVLSLTILNEPAYTTVQRLVQTNRFSWHTRSQTWKGINSAWVSVGTDISWHGTSASCIFKGRELPL